MAKILLTSGPTRQYLDPVRYLTNASSGQMGAALATAIIDAGHDVVIVSGPVHITYPDAAQVVDVLTTDELMMQCQQIFPECVGVIGVAAPCDYKVEKVSDTKLAKSGDGLILKLVETPDVIATLGRQKTDRQWAVGFALETHDAHFRAVMKMQKKCCDLMVVNGAGAINSPRNQITILAPDGSTICEFEGSKSDVAETIVREITTRLIS